MKILLTGVSSFTGFWFARKLTEAGHEAVATCTRGSLDDYAGDGVRGERMQWLVDQKLPGLRFVFDCRFGDDKFLALIERESFDVMAHHGADVTDYKSPDFNVAAAVDRNTNNLRSVLIACADSGCRRIVLTGSVFEGGEGAGSQGLPHFSPYGLSKAITAEMFKYYCEQAGLRLGKFVIPNPFGPFEEPRFTAYLMRTWVAGNTAGVNTPAYVRDNIHVEQLAAAYVAFVSGLSESVGFAKTNPSGYAESQGAFAERFAREMSKRLGLTCGLDLSDQTEFTEPYSRINTDRLVCEMPDDDSCWDAVANYYAAQHGLTAR